MSAFRQLIVAAFGNYGQLASAQLDQLEEHHNLLNQWNQRINLTRINDILEAVRLHYCESLFLGTKLPPGPLRVADLGSGAGFPGVPVAILRPEVNLTLIESHQRKAVFLRQACENIKNVTIVAKRADQVCEKFDWVISRAVSPKVVLNSGLARNYALLLGAGNVPLCAHTVPSPWAMNRVLAFYVSRGTGT